mmetsp:Transcript_102080/g.304672  ORF Transcript_102080/g.304672 Transcript_102080/m.304672 type:complete len:271 (-) Transcript_102080:43-855(-)
MALARAAATLVLLCAPASAHTGHAQAALRHNGANEADQDVGLVRALEFDHRLRVCNAFPGERLEVLRGENLTGDEPMAYRECRDFHTQLRSGDKLEFKLGSSTSGTFAVSELPSNDAVLLLVVHRHDGRSTAVSFKSHVFANLKTAQVAVIDAYAGSKRTTMRIMDAPSSGKNRTEELRYDSVVALSPGAYEVEFVNGGEPKVEFTAAGHESYVVLRTGVEEQKGPSVHEDIVVYPHSPSSPRSGAAGKQAPWAALVFGAAAVAASTLAA